MMLVDRMQRVEILTAAGKALFGDQWQLPLARALSFSDRLVRRWAAGAKDIPDAVLVAVVGLLQTAADAREAEATELQRNVGELRRIAESVKEVSDVD